MPTEEYKFLMENKVLRLKWEKFEDNVIFYFNETRKRFEVMPTKSNVIKAIASICDPLRVVKPNCSTNVNIILVCKTLLLSQH